MKNTTQEALDLLSLLDGVGYNKVNSINTINKENKENKVKRTSPPSFDSQAIAFPKVNPQGLASSDAVRAERQSSPTPDPMKLISQDTVAKCHIAFFDNGPQAKQQYKLKTTIVFSDNTQAEFIASLTRDRRNFMKHLPEDSKDATIQEVDQVRKNIIKQYENKPYLGKFHFNNGFGTQETKSSIEPFTWTVVYWDPTERVWAGMLSIYGLWMSFDLFTEGLTPAQKRGNMKAKETWHNPKFKDHDRPKTWAERQRK